MKYLAIIALLFLGGCSTIRAGAIGSYHGIGNHPYQSVGMYEINDKGYVSRIVLNKSRVKKINKDEYYIEIIIRTGMSPYTPYLKHMEEKLEKR